jgi:hypothetical protein
MGNGQSSLPKPITTESGCCCSWPSSRAISWRRRIGQNTTPVGAAFASACGGLFVSGSIGREETGGNTGKECGNNTSIIGGVAIAAALEAGTRTSGGVDYSYSGDAFAQGGQGVIKINNTGSGSAATPFAGWSANAAWNETFTLTGGAPNGTAGIWMTPLHIDGTLTASGIDARPVSGGLQDFSDAHELGPCVHLFLQGRGPMSNGKVQ